MHFRISLIHLVALVIASLGGLTPMLGQPSDPGYICDISRGEIQGVVSFKAVRFLASQTSMRSFLAVWREPEKGGVSSTPGQLVICEKNGLLYKEVFRFEDKARMEFLEFAPLSSLTVPGVVVTFAPDIVGWKGPTLIVALVQDKFEIVFEGGTSEVVDLDGNGIPEIFESVWPDGDGYPRRTLIHVWDGVKYRKLTSSKWEYRFSRSVLNRLRGYSKTRK
jgi:hypothetical protein